MNEIKEVLLGILFPRRCPICGEIVKVTGKLICPECKRKLEVLKEPACKKCGKPLPMAELEFCFDCSVTTHYFECGRAVYLYEKEIKKAVHQLKYKNKKEYGDFFAESMAENLGESIQKWNPDVLIPIPMYWKKKHRRGYNQAELLAKGLSELLNIPCSKKLLKKVRSTDSQKELTHEERKKNLKKAFHIEETEVELEVALLVDDVFTTGSTIDAAARVLLEHGVKKVYYVSLCIGKGTV